MDSDPALSLPEWVVLAVIDEHPTHGFAVAALTMPGGELGRIWQIARPVVYRSLGRLRDAGLVVPEGTQAGRGPQRTIYSATATGSAQVRGWLQTPVEHVRDVRSKLLLKLALIDRRGGDPSALVARQKTVIRPIVQAVQAEAAEQAGFERTLLAWRRASAAATSRFLDEITATR